LGNHDRALAASGRLPECRLLWWCDSEEEEEEEEEEDRFPVLDQLGRDGDERVAMAVAAAAAALGDGCGRELGPSSVGVGLVYCT